MCCAGTFRPQAHQDVIRLLELSLQAFRLVLGLDILWRLRILSLGGSYQDGDGDVDDADDDQDGLQRSADLQRPDVCSVTGTGIEM